jgi:hypothetical protein
VENLWTIRASPVEILPGEIFLSSDHAGIGDRARVEATFAGRFA